MPATAIHTTARARLAELELLERYDWTRRRLGHDFGAGQRAHELSRRRRWLASNDTSDTRAATGLELLEAYVRIGRPRLARAESGPITAATARTIATWRNVRDGINHA
jgi:hypothetical protein